MSPAPGMQMTQAVSVALVSAASYGAGTLNAPGVDAQDFEGVVEVLQNLGSVTGSISGAKLQHSDTSGGTYTDIDQGGQAFGTTASAVSAVKVNTSEVKRWIRYTAVITTGPVVLAVSLCGFKKYR